MNSTENYSNMVIKITYQDIFKNLLDQTLGWLAFIVLSPLFLLIALLIRLETPGRAFFKQRRIGRDGRPFMVYKFRSMVDGAVRMGLGIGVSYDDPRITRVGRFLRNTSLDELPQLINIIKGEMSLVGPRPALPSQAVAFDAFQRRRLLTNPGITGWAQINGRNTIPWEERIKLDVWYVDNWSLKLDLYILLRTVQVWISQEGLYGPAGSNLYFGLHTIAEDNLQ